MFHPSFFDQLDNPAWVKVNTEADAASILCKMFDRQAKPPWTRWAKHQPVCTFRKILLRETIRVKTRFGEIKVKVSKIGEEIKNIAPEYEDCKQIAAKRNIPLKDLYDEAKRAARQALFNEN